MTHHTTAFDAVSLPSAFATGDGASVDELEPWMHGPPSRPHTANSPYSVARQRARKRVEKAHGSLDVLQRKQRLAAAVQAAQLAGVSEDALKPAHAELHLIEATSRLLPQDNLPMLPLPSPTDPSLQLNPMTPVGLRPVLSSTITRQTVALLTLSDDGVAELRDAADPLSKPAFQCVIFKRGSSFHPAPPFAVLTRDFNASSDGFDYAALRDMLEDCEPFRSIVAVVDPLRAGSQILCSRCLSRGPQSKLIAFVAAVPGINTPAPFFGPSYGGLAALVCLGGDSLGVGCGGRYGAGPFGRAIGFAERASAYEGGWPSPGIGRLAYDVAVAASPLGGSGTFLFGHKPGSDGELARADSVMAWLKADAPWRSCFGSVGVDEAEYRAGLKWLRASERADMWPRARKPVPKGDGDEDEDPAGGEGADDAAGEADGDAGDASKTPVAEEEPEFGICAGGPPPAMLEPVPVAARTPPKHAVAFGAAAETALRLALELRGGAGSVVVSAPGANTSGVDQFADVLLVADLADSGVLTWPNGAWSSWVSAVRSCGGLLACAALLPNVDDPEVDWHSIVLALGMLVRDFNFVLWLGHRNTTPAERQAAALTALLEPSVSLTCLAAHLFPFEEQHFAVAYCGATVGAMVEDLQAACCTAVVPVSQALPAANLPALVSRLSAVGVSVDEAKDAAEVVHAMLHDFVERCGMPGSGHVVASPPPPAEGEGEGEGEGDAAGEAEGAEGDAEGEGVGGEEAEPPSEGDRTGAAGFAPAVPPPPSGEAKLLSFVLGGAGVAVSTEAALTFSGERLLDSPEDGPSMAYPSCAYGPGAVTPRPWGSRWSVADRQDVVALCVHSRALYGIATRILAGLAVELEPLDGEEAAPHTEKGSFRRAHASAHARREKQKR
eukprot:TRINITY_DN22771_c0_g1_i1.p1 TRINITY_DN22771_c0_g1~~TRINITY_DN22771_c0_g1_i1.p1  ORF type:complete len:895 (-),score=168.74 TRINITY_DN22771_c0_g1_i1:99-2783(-)